MLDKQLNLILKFAKGKNLKKIYDLPIEEARVNVKKIALQMGLKPLNSVKTNDLFIERKDKSSLKLRVFSTNSNEKRPLLIFFHGGGYAVYDIDTHDSFCRYLAEELGINVVAVDYRRAPEHRYPAALDDAIFATKWVIDHFASLNGFNDKIMLCGDSVGGQLALLVNNALFQEANIKILILLYPVIGFDKNYLSYDQYGVGYFLDTKTMDWFTEMYFGKKEGIEEELSSTAFKKNSPVVYVCAAEYDVLRDQANEFRDFLLSIEANVEYRLFETLPHNFALMAGSVNGAKIALAEICNDIKTIMQQHQLT